MRSETIISGRFNGPPASGNGGYSCGMVGAHLEGASRIRLHVPPPLDTTLRIFRREDGGIEMYDGDTLVASGASVPFDLDVPEPPAEDEARNAMENFPCYEGHLFPTCFVCGPEREHHDGLALFPGPVPGRASLWACLWHPAEDLVDDEGVIRPEILWSALDCPGYFAAMDGTFRPAVLGELTGELLAPVPGTDPLVVYAWRISEDGRKFYSGTAIAHGSEVVARAKSIWIELKTSA